MALYEFTCEDGHTFDRHLPMEGRDAPQGCECGKAASRILYAKDLVWKMGKQGLIRSRLTPNDGIGYIDRPKEPKTFAARSRPSAA